MGVAAALVLYAVIWFLCLFIMLPRAIRTQGDSGPVVSGTPASAPTDPQLAVKLKWTTLLTTLIWALVCSLIISGLITIEDIDLFNRWSSDPAR